MSIWNKPKVTKREFRQTMSALREKGLSSYKIKEIKKIFSGSLHEGGIDKGIDRKEIDRTIKLMRDKKIPHNFSDKQIDSLEKSMKKRL